MNKIEKYDLLLELKKSGITDSNILNVIEDVDRSLFIDKNLKKNIIENIYIYTFKIYDILHMCCF